MRSQFKRAAVVLALAANIALPVISGLRAQARLRDGESELAAKTAEVRRLLVDNAGLSDALHHADKGPDLAPEEKRELLRLRGRMAELRGLAAEAERLKALQERAGDLRKGAPSERQDPVPARALAVWPADQLAFAGCATPQAALQTAFWAMRRGDLESFARAIYGPDMSESDLDWLKQLRPEEREWLQKQLAATLASASAFHVVSESIDAEGNRCVLEVHFEGEARTRKMVVQKEGQGWRFAGILFPGMQEPVPVRIQ